MSTTSIERPQIKITRPAREHLGEIIRILKEHGESASMTRLVSELILALPLPSFIQDRRLAVQVDYCPVCQQVVPYHNGICQTCNSALVHLQAMTIESFEQLMVMARVGSLRETKAGE